MIRTSKVLKQKLLVVKQPSSGLAVITKYSARKGFGTIEVFSLLDGKPIWPRVKVSDTENREQLVQLGVYIALVASSVLGHSKKIYCSDTSTNTKVGQLLKIERGITCAPFKVGSPIKSPTDVFRIIFSEHISQLVSFWRPQWGSLQEHLTMVRKKCIEDRKGGLPF